MSYALALAWEDMTINQQKSDNEETITRSYDKFKIGDLSYVKKDSQSLGIQSGKMDFKSLQFQLLQCCTAEHSKQQI